MLVHEVDSRQDVEPVASGIFEALTRPIRIGDHELQVAPSVGAALFPDDGGDPMTLLRKADTAMYQAKKQRTQKGRTWFTDPMLQESQEALTLGSALRHAVEQEELTIHYPPEVSLHTGRVVGMEALLRWRHRGVNVSPARFIPIAEDSGLTLKLGEWTLRRACQDCAELQRRLDRRLTVAVNVSPLQFQQPGWLDIVASALAQSGLHASQLELEITESLLMQNPEETVRVLRALRRMGIRVAIDDSGTGYSNLAYVTRFPIDKIKIDRAFVRELTTHDADAAVVHAVIAMARRLGVRVIAEGVESPDLVDCLVREGCDEAQGFFFSPGVPIGEVEASLDAIERVNRLPPRAVASAAFAERRA